MITIVDNEGTKTTAYKVLGPTVLNTINSGEVVAEVGQWVVTIPSGGIVVISEEQLYANFKIEES